MSLQSEIDKTRKEIFTDGYPMSIGELINLYQNDELDIHPEFQRFYRWEPSQKSKFIESILLGIPIPPIFVSQREDGVWDVIDGVQRLSTIFEFIGVLKNENNEVMSPEPLEKTYYLPSLKNKLWTGKGNDTFTPSQKINFKREKLDIRIIKKESDPNIKYELFQRINALGTQLSDQELRNCMLIMHDRSFYLWLYKLANLESFKNCINLSEQDISKQFNLDVALRFFIFKNIDLSEITSSIYLADFISQKMLDFAKSKKFNRNKEEKIFKDTFELLNNTLAGDSFTKYDVNKEKFVGRFLLSTFEVIAIGIGSNIDEWNKLPRNKKLDKIVRDKAISLWKNPQYNTNIGTGVNFYTRIPILVPLGKKFFKP